MLALSEMTVLSDFCRSHALRWVPATAEPTASAFRLERNGRRVGTTGTVILHRDGQFHLVDDDGDPLAVSSTLQPVLDALDGGIAERSIHSPFAVSQRVR